MTVTRSSSGGRELFGPAQLGPVTLRNRVIKAATFEGMSRDGLVSGALVEFHRRMAAGGAAMTTLAYVSVASDGRTCRHQIWMREDVLAGLRRLTAAVHAEGARAAVQLGHAGYFAGRAAIGTTPVGPSRVFNPAGLAFSRAAAEGDLDRIAADFGRAAALAVRAAVRGAGAAVYAKLNMEDGFRGGLQLADAIEVARLLEAGGTVDALELTGGFSSRTPMFLMRGEVPLPDMIRHERSAARRLGLRVAGRRFMRAYPFGEAFFRPAALQVRAAVSLPLILLGGILGLDTMRQAMADRFGFVALGRALLREPDLVARLAARQVSRSARVSCNRCVVQMEAGGTRCVFVPEQEWMTGGGRGAR